ncbi:MAG: hypothetical protein IPK32_25230 [Verrucomicrobiaceae bacterium]|nr:hypothetical protein [Verrucomicrobiaceae bacterium]
MVDAVFDGLLSLRVALHGLYDQGFDQVGLLDVFGGVKVRGQRLTVAAGGAGGEAAGGERGDVELE